VDNLNKMTADTAWADKTLEEIVREADGGVFNNAAQIWNHTFLWHSMSPNGGGEPSSVLATAINSKFGSFDAFRDAFKQAAMGQFGSGWAWLVRTNSGVEIMTTGNADTPLVHGKTALLTLDVWEHAYYLDFQNRRDAYIDTFLDSLVDWEFAAKNYAAA
jgi:Fe-Mn family superoxide dismutase